VTEKVTTQAQRDRRKLSKKARQEGWDDEKRVAHGLRALGARNKGTKKTTSTPMAEAEIVEMFGDRSPGKNRGDIVPPPGSRSDRTGRKRIRGPQGYKDSAGRNRISSLGQRWSKIHTDVKNGEFTWEEFAATLTPEELARGQLMDSRGSFSGRPPAFVPRAFHDACIRELLNRGQVLYKENYVQAINTMTAIATDERFQAKDRIKAAQFVIERLEGKVPDRLEISAADPWQAVIADIVAEAEDNQIARAQQYLNRSGESVVGNNE
jgi:hypothetical protein